MTRATTPIGTLIQKMLCQSKRSTRVPPISGPMARARPEMPAHMPIARARSRGSRKVLVMIDSVLGSISAPPMPWTTRAPIRNEVDGARAHRTEPPVNSARPPMNALRRPNRSPSVPPVSSRLASASTKASTIHCTSEKVAPSLTWMVFSARFTTVLSSITMNSAKHMHARVRRFLRRSVFGMVSLRGLSTWAAAPSLAAPTSRSSSR